MLGFQIGTDYRLTLRTGLPAVDVHTGLPARDGRGLANDVTEKLKSVLVPESVVVRLEENPDASVSEPIVCANFSEELHPSDADRYRPYVEVTEHVEPKNDFDVEDRQKGNPVTGYEIVVDKQELCILGLEFGTAYDLGLLAGLPAQHGSELPNDTFEVLKIDAILPQISFRGQTLFLPVHGEGLVPVSTLNVDSLELTLLRVGDRNLTNEIALGRLGNRIGASEIVQLREATGETIWRGSIEIDSKPNVPALTGIPVRDLTELYRRLGEPGIDEDPAVAGILPGVQVDPARKGVVDAGVYALVARRAHEAALDRDFSQAVANDESFAVQWLAVTDLALSLFRSEHDLLVAARSLSQGRPRPGVRVQLVSRNNRVLSEEETGGHGIARFDGNLARGKQGTALTGVLAFADDGQFAFLDATTDMIDLGDRGIDGRLPAGALDAYVYTERGIYRPGETVHAGVIVRNSAGRPIDPASLPPLSFRVRAPNDTEISSRDLKDPRDGAYGLTFDVPDTALSGLWRLDVRLGNGGETIGGAGFEVGDFLPGRIRLELPEDGQPLAGDSTKHLKLIAEYLYGGPAADLPGEGLVEIREAAVPWAAHKAAEEYKSLPAGLSPSDFVYGLADEDFAPRRTRLDLLRTDRRGQARIPVRVDIPDSTQPLEALIQVQLFDTDGSRTEARHVAPVRSDRDWIGIHQRTPFPRAGAIELDLLYFDADGAPLARRPLYVRIYRLRDAYAWQNFNPASSASWTFEPQTQVSRLWEEDLSVRTGEEGLAGVRVPMDDLGRVLIEVRDGSTAVASLRFDSGWTGVPEVPGAPDRARLMLDSKSYSPGEKARLSVEAPFSGEGLFLIGNERIHSWVTGHVDEAGTELALDVAEDWGPCAYVIGSVFRSEADASRERGPGRAIGLAHFCISETERRLAVSFTNVGKRILPNQKRWKADMRVDGVQPGTQAFLTVALVDEGILNLNEFKPPAPQDYFFGKRQLGVDIYDAYDRIILSEGVRGMLRSGGGYGQLRGLRFASPIILSQFSGILPVAPDGTASTTFDIPEFAGRVKLMAAAWSGDSFGSAEQSVSVLPAFVSRLSLPKFLAPGDLASLTLSVLNSRMPGRARPFAVEVTLDENKDNGPLVFADRSKRMVLETPLLGLGDEHREPVEITPLWSGEGEVQIKVTDTDTGKTYQSRQLLSIRPAHAERTRRFAAVLAPGSSLDIARTFRERVGPAFVGKDLSLAVRISPEMERLAGLTPSEWLTPSLPHLDSLVGYAERMLPEVPPGETGNREALQKVVHGISGLKTSYGFFRAVRQERVSAITADKIEEDELGVEGHLRIAQTIRAVDVLIAALDKGLRVPGDTLTSAVSFVEQAYRSGLYIVFSHGYCGYFQEVSGFAWLPNAAYVLARANRLKRSDLERLARCELAPEDLLGAGYVAAAHCLFGLTDACRSGFEEVALRIAEGAGTGANLDEKAMVLALMVESGAEGGLAAPLRQEIKEALLDPGAEGELSIQARAALSRAFAEMSAGDRSGFDLKIDGRAQTVEGTVHRIDGLRPQDVLESYVIENLQPDKQLALEVLVRGVPLLGEESDSAGFELERIVYDLDGNRLDLGHEKLHLGQLLVVEIAGQVPSAERRKAMLIHLMPAGIDVEETELLDRQPLSTKLRRIVRSPADRGAFAKVSLRERRDDRFVAVLDFDDERRTRFRVHFLARVVVAGDYSLPEVLIEDLEHPEISARTGAGSVSIKPQHTGP